MPVRALYRAISIPGASPPYGSAALKVYYPACYGGSEEERNSGVIPAASEGAPFPVVIILPGINVGPEGYAWLARELATHNIVTVTYTLVAEEMPGYISLTPGLALPPLMPANYGHSASATALAPIIEDLEKLNAEGVLVGRLDLHKIVLGGHSAGGTVALVNARPDWFPGLCAAFTYGAHAGAATALGYEPHSLFALPPDLPLLIMGGTRDGCIAHSASRYGHEEVSSPTALVERTFDEAISRDRGDCYLALIEGANHFSMSWPHDDCTGRPFIDLPTTRPDDGIRELLGSLVVQFIAATARDDGDCRALLENTLLQSQAFISRGDRR